jgi:hypothetical protein
MKKNLFAIFLIPLFFSCSNAQAIKEKKYSSSKLSKLGSNYLKVDSLNNLTKEGVILVRADSLHLSSKSVAIYNFDNSIFSQIKSTNGNEPSSNLLKNKILAYFPDYYIIHFKAKEQNENYIVQVGNEMKKIKQNQFIEFLSWEEYITKFFCITDEKNPLYENPTSDSKIVKELTYQQLNFTCLEVKGDWVKVVCNKDCEGCPSNGKLITGWIKWRKNGKIILKQRYAC